MYSILTIFFAQHSHAGKLFSVVSAREPEPARASQSQP